MSDRIYLDNAATTWPKPESVYAAVEQSMRKNGVSVGRGAFQQSVDTVRSFNQTRGAVAKLINSPTPNSIVFTSSGTDSLSTAILGFCQPVDHVVTTAAEHNSVLRPLHHLRSELKLDLTVVDCDETGMVTAKNIAKAITSQTKLLVMTHASNATGAVLPIAKTIELAKQINPNLVVLIDAAQTLGHLPIDVQALSIDILAAPGHKGLLGPLGNGLLYLSPQIADRVSPLRYGGTGVSSSDEIQPTAMPEKFEAGNLNAPAIAGLKAGIEYIESDEGMTHLQNQFDRSKQLLEGLQTIDGIDLHLPEQVEHRLGIFSFTLSSVDDQQLIGPHEIASMLDSAAEIQVRSGLHCAPLLHRQMKTASNGGTVRLSVGGFNTAEQIEKTIETIRLIAASAEMI
jgi:cysteine desulfurase family protein